MQSIFASKLYKASKHKDKIKAALSDPLNSELVIQLKEYLNEEDLDELKPADNTTDSDSSDNQSENSNDHSDKGEEAIRPSQHSTDSGHPSASSNSEPDHHLSKQVAEFEENRDAELANEKKTFEVQSPESSSDTASSDINVSESTRPAATSSVLSSSIIYPSLDVIPVDAIIGALNAREDTAGVCRAALRDHELWIHYNDSVNLNNVMEPVIALLNATGYKNLDFNRLARTENAIVFTVSQFTVFQTCNPIEPLKEVASE